MEIALIILAGAFVSALNILCFACGVIYGKKHSSDKAVFDKATIQAMKDSAEWINY